MGEQRTLHPSKRKQSQLTAAPSQRALSALTRAEHADKESSLRSASQHQLVGYGIIQPKLTISQPADAAEREADQVADQLTRPMPEAVAPTAVSGRVMLQAESHPDDAPEAPAHWQERTEALRGSGQPLPPSVREFFEPRFGYDFGQVRIHTGPEANARAREVNAQAFTMGKDIVFGAGKFAPQEPAGQHLLAHELTHVVQQGEATLQVQRKAAPEAEDPAVNSVAMNFMETELRRQAGNRLNDALSNFNTASLQVLEELKEKQAEPSLIWQLVELVVGALAPGYVNLLIGKFKDQLKVVASAALGLMLEKHPHLAVKSFLTADWILDKFISEVDEEQVTARFLTIRDAFQEQLPLVAGGSSPALTGVPLPGGPVPTVGAGNAMSAADLVKHVRQAFLRFKQNFDSSLPGQKPETLIGILAAYDAYWIDIEVYAAQIRDLVAQHEELARVPAYQKRLGPGGDAPKIVLIEARGVTRPAIIEHDPGMALIEYPHWKFKKWVPSEMIGTAEAIAKNQEKGLEVVKAGAPYGWVPIQGYIPDPEMEAERIVEVHMWGELRLCVVNIEGDEATFVKWLPKEAFTFIKGARQKGGIQRFDAKKFKNGGRNIPVPPK